MLKRDITYENPFTKEMVTETHYFHISKAGIVEMQMANLKEPEIEDGDSGEKLDGYRAKLQRIVNDQSGDEVMAVIADMIHRSYGRREEGDKFLRATVYPEIWKDFTSSEAYSQLYFELCTNAESQADFINGVFPRDMVEAANKIVADTVASGSVNPETASVLAATAKLTESPPAPTPDPTGLTPKTLTRDELATIDPNELRTGLAEGRYKVSA